MALGLISGLLLSCRAGWYTGICGRQASFAALVFCAIIPIPFASFRNGSNTSVWRTPNGKDDQDQNCVPVVSLGMRYMYSTY